MAIFPYHHHHITKSPLSYNHITITILYDDKPVTMHDDDDDYEHDDNDDDDNGSDDDDEDYDDDYYIEDGDNDDNLREMLYADQFGIPICRMNYSKVRHCDQIIRNHTRTALPPSDHPDHHQYGAHSGLSRLA